MHVGGAAHTHIIGPTCDLSGPRANHRAHVRVIGPTCAARGARARGTMQGSQERGKHKQLKSRLSRVTKPKSHPASNTICPSFKLAHATFNTNFSAPASRKVTTKPTRSVLLPFNPETMLIDKRHKKAAPRGGLVVDATRRSYFDPDIGRHLAGCSMGSVDFRTRCTSSALIASS